MPANIRTTGLFYKTKKLLFDLFTLISVCVLCFNVNTLSAQQDNSKSERKKKLKIKPDMGLEFEARTFYDDNILKYSKKYLTRFINREDEGRFHINTYDDVIFRPSLKFNASQRLIKKLNTGIDLSFNRSFYLNNGIKSWSSFSFDAEQSLSSKAKVGISYSYIPDFYIRHYRDDDYVYYLGYIPETFKPMSFAKESYDIWGQFTFLKNTGVKFTFDYTRYFYNACFIEYDSDDLTGEIRIIQPFGKKIRLQLAYEFTGSKAKGYDQPGETLENSDDADASLYDNTFTANVRWTLPTYFKLNHTLTFDASFGKKVFTTDHFIELDLLHTGRIDYNYKISALYRVKVNADVSATIFYNYFGRSTTSRSEINSEYISLEKNYSQNQAGFSLIYNYKYKYPKKNKK